MKKEKCINCQKGIFNNTGLKIHIDKMEIGISEKHRKLSKYPNVNYYETLATLKNMSFCSLKCLIDWLSIHVSR